MRSFKRPTNGQDLAGFALADTDGRTDARTRTAKSKLERGEERGKERRERGREEGRVRNLEGASYATQEARKVMDGGPTFSFGCTHEQESSPS